MVVVRSVAHSLINYCLFLICLKRFFILSCLVLSGLSSAFGQTSSNSEFDTFKLANGLTLQVQSDPKLDSTSVAIAVRVGSLSDPIGFPGMAHFVEHLMLASSQESGASHEPSLRQLVNQWGGQLNAHTTNENTLFYFQLTPQATESLLGAATNLLSTPIVDKDTLSGELVALDHEFSLRAESPRWQERDALKSVVPAHHPFHRLHPGSQDSLTRFGMDELSRAVQLFQRQYYVPAATTIVIASPIAEDDIVNWVSTGFGSIENRRIPSQAVAPLFTENHLPKSIDILGHADQKQITLLFPASFTPTSVDDQVFHYLQYMLESEHEGSFIARLRTAGLATAISATKGISINAQNSFQITLSLTQLGWTSIPQIRQDLIAYLDLMHAQGLTEWRIREFHNLARLSFVKKQNQWSTLERVRRLALKHPIQPSGFSSAEFKGRLKLWLTQLQGDKALTIRVSDQVMARERSPVFGTAYAIPSEEQRHMVKTPDLVNHQFQLPQNNPYIPSQWQAIKASDSLFEGVPQLMVDHQNVEVWFGVDGGWADNMATIQLLLNHAAATESIENAVSTELILEAVNQRLYGLRSKLEPLAYELEITSQSQGVAVSLSGHAETLPQLALTVLQALQEPLTRKEFVSAQAALAKQWQSPPRYGFEELFEQLFVELLDQRWGSNSKLETMGPLQFETTLAQQRLLFPSQRIIALIYGQMAKNRANEFVSELMQDQYVSSARHSYAHHFSQINSKGERFPLQILANGTQKRVSVNTINPDNAFVLYHQAINGDPVTTGTIGILRQLLHSRYFQTLRNELKMGYAVFVTSFPVYNLAGFAMTVQSPNASPELIERQTESFLQDFNRFLNTLDEKQFRRAKAGVLRQLSWREKPPKDRAEMLWQQILTGRLPAFLASEESELIDQISLSDIRRYYQNYIIGQQGNRVVLESRIPDFVKDDVNVEENTTELLDARHSM